MHRTSFLQVFFAAGLLGNSDVQTALAHQGIDFGGSFVYHLDGNAMGGLKRGVTNQWLLNMNLRFHSERIFHFSGGELFVNFQAHQGRNPSYVLTGDNFFYDGLSALDFVQLSEYWIEQQMGPFSVKIGRIDAVADLAFTRAATYLINNSFEAIPSIFGFSTYPSPSPGLILRYQFLKNFEVKGAIFNGMEMPTAYQYNYPFGDYKQYFENLFFQLELEGKFFEERCRALIGATYNQAPYTLYVLNNRAIGGSLYGIVEANFFEEVDGFLQLGVADPYHTLFSYYIGWGVKWGQPIFQDLENVLSFGMATGFYSPQSRQFLNLPPEEIALEFTYRLIYKKIGIQPDLQYIINPSSFNIPNALGFILSFDIKL